MPRKPSFASALSTALNPPKVDPWAILGYEPACVPFLAGEIAGPCGQCPQEVFATADEHTVIMGGAAAGGKTLSVLMYAIRACMQYPRLRVGAFRRSYPELRDSLIAELANYGYCDELGARFNQTEYELRFPNGSLIAFRYAETMQDATRRQGSQLQLLVLDELTLFDPQVVSFLQSRVRSGRADVPVLGVRATCNPGGPGHSEVKKILEKTGYGERTYTDERGREVRFVKAGLKNNPYINPEYAADLRALPEKLRRAFLDGDWDSFEGMVFPELDRDRHVIRPFTIPASWRKLAGIDWGYRAPFACCWIALDGDERVYVFRELYQSQVPEEEQARRILEAEGDEVIERRLADDAMWATRGSALPLSEVYLRAGCVIEPAGKGAGSRVAGWQRIRGLLTEAPACPLHRAPPFGWATCPRLHIFSTCEHLWSELSSLPHSPRGNPEDADTKAPDHAADALRYVTAAIGTGPSFPILGDPEAPAAGELNELGVEVLEPYAGLFAIRRDPYDEWESGPGLWADEDLDRRIVWDAREAGH